MTLPTNSPPPRVAQGDAPLAPGAGARCATTSPPYCLQCAATLCRLPCRRPRKNLREHRAPRIRTSRNGRWTVLCCLPRSTGWSWSNSIRGKTTGKTFFCMASKPINIRWIRNGSLPYWIIMYSIILQTIFHVYWNKDYKIDTIFVGLGLQPLETNKTALNYFFYFNIRGKLLINRCIDNIY